MIPLAGLKLPAIIDGAKPGSKLLVLPQEWMPHPGETDEEWTSRLGPRAVAIIDVLLKEKP